MSHELIDTGAVDPKLEDLVNQYPSEAARGPEI